MSLESLITELSEPQYVGLSEQAAADLINATR